MLVEMEITGRPVIEIRGVSVAFEKVTALERVSLTLRHGDLMIITGTSGSGKTVLLHLATGLIAPDEGQVLIDGRDLSQLSERQLLDLRSGSIGLVFQEDTLFTGLTVYENTAYRLNERGWTEQDTDSAVLEILRFVGLEDHLEKLPEELSIGMRRRLELARALVGWPPIMLFDEPTSGLDPINARHVLDLIIRARDLHNISSLYVTKELHEISYLGGHHALVTSSGTSTVETASVPTDLPVILLEKGRIVFSGSATELQSSGLPAVLRMTHPEAIVREREQWRALQRL